jgi:hypothetical protein
MKRGKTHKLSVKLKGSENGSLRMPVLKHKIVYFAPEFMGGE